MFKEIELKLSLPANCIKHLQHLPQLTALSISKPIKQKLFTIYYDTPDLTLTKQNCALRVRRIGQHWVQTIKTEGSVTSGLHERDEWERPITSNQPDFTQFSDLEIPQLFSDPDLYPQLQPIFTTRFTRLIHILKTSEGGQIEFCLDHGKIIADHAKAPICEIELELKSGKPIQLFRFALALTQALPFPLRLENTSKAERGYMLYTGYEPPPVKTASVVIRAEMDLTTAFTLIVQNCLDQLTRNEHGMLAGNDIEYLHQMRVALRRLRSALDVFSAAIPDEVPIKHELKWLTRQLNPARDWDVFVMEELSQIQESFSKHTGIPAFKKICEKLRQAHNEAARNSIRSKRYSELILRLNLWLDELPKNLPQSRSSRNVARIALSTFTNTLLTQRHQQILTAGKDTDKLDATSLHALRISIKKQRYAVEFFHTLFQQEEAKQYIRALSELQDILGIINDSTKTQDLLAEISIGKTRTLLLQETVGIILGWNAQRLQQKKGELKRELLAFCNTPLFW